MQSPRPSRGRTWIITLLLAPLLSGCIHSSRKSDKVARLLNAPRTRIDGRLLVTALAPDAIRAIDAPRFLSPGEKYPYPRRARILGVQGEETAKAYPLRIMNRHELVNDELDGEPVAIAWCPILQGGKGFIRRLGPEGEPFLLGVSGKLWGNGLVAFDRPTATLFTLWDGHALRGPHRGKSLESFELTRTTLGEWLDQHPDSLILAPPDPLIGIHPRERDRRGLRLALRPKFLPPPRRLRRIHHHPLPARPAASPRAPTE